MFFCCRFGRPDDFLEMRMRMKCSATVLALIFLGAAACSRDPEAAKQRYVTEGDRYVAEKKYQEAVLQYRNAIKQDSNFGAARAKLAGAYLALGDTRNALKEAVRAADLMPADVDVQLQAGSLLFYSGQFPEARARAQAVLNKEPKNAHALILLGNSLAGLKDIDAAIEQVEQAIDESPALTFSYANLGGLYLAKGDLEAAESTFKRAVAAAPDSVQAHLSLANFLWASGRQEDAERELKIAAKLDPKSATTNRALATFYMTSDRLVEAEPHVKAYADATGTTASNLVLADFYVRHQKIAEATGILTTLADLDDGLVPASVRLAALDFTAGRIPEAYRRLESVLSKKSDNVTVLQAKTRFLLLEKKSKEALALANRLVEADSKAVPSLYLQAVALEATGAVDEAVKAFRDLLARNPSSTGLQMKLAQLHLRQRKFKEALSLTQQLVKAQPRSVDAHFVHAQALLRSGDLVNAERILLALEKVASSSAEVHSWLGMLYESKGDVKSARRSFDKALELQPQMNIALAGLVSADLAEKKPAVALGRIESRLGDRPDDVRLVAMSGMAHLAVRDLPKAEAAFRRLLELDPNNIDAYARLGAIYMAQRRLDEAKQRFEEMARHQATPTFAETMVGTILLHQNKREEARKHFERAVQLDPRAAVAANNLAWDYANNGGNLDIALQLAQAAKAELPDVAQVTDTLGWIYYKKGLGTLAVTTLGEATKQDPSNPRIHHRLGLAYLQAGNKAAARRALERALQLKLGAEDAAEVRRVLATI